MEKEEPCCGSQATLCLHGLPCTWLQHKQTQHSSIAFPGKFQNGKALACTLFLVYLEVMQKWEKAMGKHLNFQGNYYCNQWLGPCAAGWFYWVSYMGCTLPSLSHSQEGCALCTCCQCHEAGYGSMVLLSLSLDCVRLYIIPPPK